MRRALLALSLSVLAADAQAISRYESTSLACADVRAIIRAEGAAIMRWRSARNPGLPLYGRYVSHEGYCNFDEYADTVYIPAADTQCPVYECKPIEFDDFFLKRRLRRSHH